LHATENKRILEPMPPAESKAKTPTGTQKQLERILESPGFSRNERLSRFLRFVVEQHLAGKDDELKESLIAIEVFGRPPDYDPKRDPIVRAEASRLRARLGEYYLGQGKDDPVIIELPKGGYVPVVRSAERIDSPGTAGPVAAGPGKWRVWVGAALALLVVITLAAAVWWRFRPQNAPIPIAVLPLINMNQDPANDYYADGLTGELIRNLSIIDGLTVRSETSSFAFKGKPQNARDVGRQLEADYIVEGSVLRSGQRLRINVQLFRARDDFPIWSDHYDRELTDIFAIQDEISRGVVNNLRLKLGQGRRRYETSPEAYDLYLRARALQRGRGSQVAPSIAVFEQAIAKDPSFAPAYAGLAKAHLSLSGNALNDIPSEVVRMRSAAEKAIHLDPLSAEAYEALAAAYARDAQWDQAESSFHRSLEIQPGRPESHGYFAIYYLLPLGRVEEATRQLQIAEKSDPLFTFFLGDALGDAGRNQESLNVCQKLAPDDRLRDSCIVHALVRLKPNEVIQNYELHPDKRPLIQSALACAYAHLGRRQDAEEHAAVTGEDAAVTADRAEAFACLGDKDRVFEALDRDAGVGPIRMGWFLLRVNRENPGLLDGDSRLQAIRKKVGLPLK
jgi:TolB-like protein